MSDEIELETIVIDENTERIGRPFGVVYPPAPAEPSPPDDPRTVALKAFRSLLSTVEFHVRGAAHTSETITFKIDKKNIHVEQPDNVVDGVFPSIVFLPGRGSYDYFGLGPPKIVDGSQDQFKKGTALIIPCEYIETFTLEVWAAKIPERRAIVAGIEMAMLNEETSTATRLLLRNYYDQVASFSLNSRLVVDDNDSARNRRRAHMFIELRVPVAQLVAVKPLQTFILDPDLDPEE